MDQQKSASVDYVRLIRRIVTHRWRIVIAAFLAIAVPTVVWTVMATEDTYEAHATLFLLPERSSPAFMREFTSPEVNALYHVLLRSRSLAQGVTEALPKDSRDELSRRLGVRDYLLTAMNHIRRLRGLEVVVYSPSEQAIRELQDTRMNFNINKDGTVIVTATAFSPRVAVDLPEVAERVGVAEPNERGRVLRCLVDGRVEPIGGVAGVVGAALNDADGAFAVSVTVCVRFAWFGGEDATGRTPPVPRE